MTTLDFGTIRLEALGYDSSKLTVSEPEFVMIALESMLASSFDNHTTHQEQRGFNRLMGLFDSQFPLLELSAEDHGTLINLWKSRRYPIQAGPNRRLIAALDRIIVADDFKDEAHA